MPARRGGSVTVVREEGKRQRSRKRILDAAAQLLGRNGYAGTSMRDIAKKAGIQAGSAYYHFSSKEELTEAVLAEMLRVLRDAVNQATEELPPNTDWKQRIEVAIRAHVRTVIEYGDYTLTSRRIYAHLPESVRARHRVVRAEYGRWWLDLLRDAKDAGELGEQFDIHLVRLFLLGALNWTAEWYKAGKYSVEEISEQFTRLVLDGILSEQRRTRGVRGQGRNGVPMRDRSKAMQIRGDA